MSPVIMAMQYGKEPVERKHDPNINSTEESKQSHPTTQSSQKLLATLYKIVPFYKDKIFHTILYKWCLYQTVLHAKTYALNYYIQQTYTLN